MDFQARNGKTYRVQFVHSAHDPACRVAGQPGGLRQFTDNLAESLQRRVTLCEISEVTIDPNLRNEAGSPLRIATALGQGFAICHYHDQFVKHVGRSYALGRALDVSGLDAETEQDIAEFCGFDAN